MEEAIESSISNIEMSKSEKSLQKPLKLAVSNLPSAQERNPSMAELNTGAALGKEEVSDSKKSKTNTSLREQSTVSNIQSQDPLVVPLLPVEGGQPSDPGDGSQANTNNNEVLGVRELECDSNTDLPQEYFQFLQQENQAIKEQIEEVTAEFQFNAREHQSQKEAWLAEIEQL